MMETNKEILFKVAGRLFNEYGFNSIEIDKICAEAGISIEYFYHYFPNKYHFIESMLINDDALIRLKLNELTPNHDYIGNIRRVFLWHTDQIILKENHGVLLLKAMNEMSHVSSISSVAYQHRKWKSTLIQQQLIGLNVKNSKIFSVLLLNVMENLLFTLDDKTDHLAIWYLLENIMKSNSQSHIHNGFVLKWLFP